MAIQSWIIGQIVLDILVAALLGWFILFRFRKNRIGANFDNAFDKSQSILAEMERITRELEKNLEEKRDLSNRIVRQLDESLSKADESRRQLQKLIKEYNTRPVFQTTPTDDAQKTRELINALLHKGMKKTEVSRHLGISMGELDLLLKLKV